MARRISPILTLHGVEYVPLRDVARLYGVESDPDLIADLYRTSPQPLVRSRAGGVVFHAGERWVPCLDLAVIRRGLLFWEARPRRPRRPNHR